jgi:5-methyltetrahydropteroyltriglutamate--homocysteine methyltransferase
MSRMVTARLIGYPRIGPQRELKRALEQAWAGSMAGVDFAERVAELRRAHLDEQSRLVGSAVDDFFLYDEVLETAMMLGIAPEQLRERIADDAFGVLTALARGTPEREAWELTKWFDTNYHYVVPELSGPVRRLAPLPWREPLAGDANVAWAVLGPYSMLKLLRRHASHDEELAGEIGRAYWSFVADQAAADSGFRLQLDEPSLGLVMDEADERARDAAYAGAEALDLAEAPLVTVQFGRPSPSTLEVLGEKGLSVQVPADAVADLAESGALDAQPAYVVGVIDGRSVWPDDFDAARTALDRLPEDDKPRIIVPTTSFLFLPYTVAGEDLPAGFQFAREKAGVLAEWAEAIDAGNTPRRVDAPIADWPEIGAIEGRASREERRRAQADLDLPVFPTTSIGSLPQTGDVRRLRVRLSRGEIDTAAYEGEMDRLITDGIAWQERKGIDVLVHGEFERTDMVEYFAAQLDGYLTTRNGWVLSYGSRCTRPPILAAPPIARGPMTVREWQVAQSATTKPVKGMLTGPVTIVNWSFRPPGVPDDRLFWAVAQPIADEVRALIDAGARVIQVDEPAVRERWPLPTVDAEHLREIYGRGVRAALNHVFNQPAHVQLHTHMCYGTDATIAPLWEGVGVDVASIWYARAEDDERIRAFYGQDGDGHLQIGPGVFDVHSPHSPGAETMASRLDHVRAYMDVGDVWVNPDCGLKTRSWPEIERQLTDMVEAAAKLRAELAAPAGRPR